MASRWRCCHPANNSANLAFSPYGLMCRKPQGAILDLFLQLAAVKYLCIWWISTWPNLTQILFLEFSKEGPTDNGENLQMVVWPTSQWYCKDIVHFSCCQVSQCYCHFQSNFWGLLKIGDFLVDPMVYAFFNEITNWSWHPDKILVTLEIGKVSILLLQLPFFSLKDLWHDVEVWWLSSSLVCDGGLWWRCWSWVQMGPFLSAI